MADKEIPDKCQALMKKTIQFVEEICRAEEIPRIIIPAIFLAAYTQTARELRPKADEAV